MCHPRGQPYEFDYDYSPAWRFVGQYLHWTPQLEALVDHYVRKTIGVPDGEVTPTVSPISINGQAISSWQPCVEWTDVDVDAF